MNATVGRLASTIFACLLFGGTLAAQQPTDSAHAIPDSVAPVPVPPVQPVVHPPQAVQRVLADTGDSARTDSIQRARTAKLRAMADSAEKARLDSLRRYELQAVVVTATRLSSVDERAPVQVEQLDIPLIIPTPTAAPSALERLPGISTFDDQGTPFQPEIQVRGFTLSPIAGAPQGISVFLNGVRQNEPDAQEVNFDLLPMAAVEGSSLVRGSNVLFGRNSLGGSLLLTTKRGTDKPEAEVETGGGSFGNKSFTFTGGGKIGGIDGFLAASGMDETGWRQATSGRTRNLFLTLGHQWGATRDSGDIALDVMYGHDKIFQAGSLPASYSGVFPRLNYTPGDFFAPDAYLVTLRGNQPLGGGIFRGTVFFRRNNYEQFNVNVPPKNPSTDGLIDNKSGGGTLEWTKAIRILRPVGLTVGADYERDGVHYRLSQLGSGSTGDSVTTLAEVTPQENVALYAQAIISATSHMNITGGVRADYVNIPYIDQLNDTNSGISTYRRVSPEIGVNYTFSNALKAYAAYKTGFRAPAALELACASPTAPCNLPSALGNDPPLKPVSTDDYEAGFDLDFGHGSSLDVSGFRTNVYNDILFAAPNLISVYFINANETRRTGLEVSGQLGLPAGFRLLGSYSYIRATFQSVDSIATSDTAPQPTKPGDIFPNSPLHQWRVGAGLSHRFGPIHFDGEFDVKGYSSQFMRGDESNQRAQLPAYHLAGLRTRVSFSRFGLELEIENLFDDSYYSFGIEGVDGLAPPPGSHISLGDDNGIPIPFLTPGLPRRFTLTLSAKL